MKITRDIIDNGRHIIHVQYEEHELEQFSKRHLENRQKPENRPGARDAEGS